MTRRDTSLVFEAGFLRQAELRTAISNLRPVSSTSLLFDSHGQEINEPREPGEALREMAAGGLSHAQWGSELSEVAWLQVHGPHAQPAAPTPWLLSFEYAAPEWMRVFEEVAGTRDCAFVVLTLEESLDVGPELNDVDRFPWDDWRLVLAELKGNGTEKPVRRRGAALARVTPPSSG